MPSGRLWAVNGLEGDVADRQRLVRGCPAPGTRPRSNSRSSSAASSWWAAMARALSSTLSAAICDGDAADGERARAVGVDAERRDGGVGVQHLDVVGLDAELVGHDHRPRGLVALAVGRGAGDDLHLAGGQHAHRGRLPAAGAVVERRQHPDWGPGRTSRRRSRCRCRGAVLDPSSRAALLLGPDARRSRPARGPGRASARSRRCRTPARPTAVYGNCVGRDEVAAPDLVRVDADLAGEARPWPARWRRWPRGGRRRGRRRSGVLVGEHAGARERVGRDVVDAVVEEGAEQRDAGRDELQVGAHVGQQLDPHGGDLAVGVGGQLDVLDLAAALDRGEGVLAALLGPAHRHAVLAGQGDGEELLGVDVELRAEAAADRRGDDPQLVLGRCRW